MTHERLTIPIFDICVDLFDDREEAQAFFRESHPEEEESKPIASARGVCITSPTCRMVCIFDPDLNIIAHESTHLAGAILKELGIKISISNDEMLAYLVGWLTVRISQFANQPEQEIPLRE